MDKEHWAALDDSGRFRRFVTAMATTMRDEAVFSHQSAAVLHGLPMLQRWPQQATITIPLSTGGRSSGNIRRVSGVLDAEEVVLIDGIACTSMARTVADLAAGLPFVDAVAVADAALHRKRRPRLMTMEELRAQSDRVEAQRGHRKLAEVVSFATTLSDSVQESRSRVIIHQLGFPPPILQQPWFDRDGYIGDTDFWWPDYRLTGEFDGLVKYLGREFSRGRSPEQIVVDEKVREDRIRACGPGMARWITTDMEPAQRLARKLLAAGLPLIRQPRF